MSPERVPASVELARRLALGPADPRVAWNACLVPQRMVIALDVLADPRWMARAACVAWRASVVPHEVHDVLASIEAWADGGAVDVGALHARLNAIELAAGAPPNAISAATFAMRALVELAADPHDPARSLWPIAAVDMAVDAAGDLAVDRLALDARIGAAIRRAIDPFPALAEETRTFEPPPDDDPIPF